MKKIFMFIIVFITTVFQAISQEVEMADTLRSEGKIYVVVTILTIIIVGLFGYLFFLDKKITRVENSIKDK